MIAFLNILSTTNDLYSRLRRNDDPNSSESMVVVFNNSRDKAKASIDELIEYLKNLSTNMLANTVECILSEPDPHHTVPNEPDPRITKIGELLLHLPVQFETIIETFPLKSLLYLSDNSILHPNNPDINTQWFQHIVRNHVKIAIQILISNYHKNLYYESDKSIKFISYVNI
ncbi:hypothetical protein HZS_3000 [Henneguya salminicola]|nr:hypothetical protein HZS_3000 [Henneguya salminicola]